MFIGSGHSVMLAVNLIRTIAVPDKKTKSIYCDYFEVHNRIPLKHTSAFFICI